MKCRVITIIAILAIAVLIAFGFIEETFAPPPPGCCSPGTTYHNVVPFITVPPPPTWASEGFTHYWSPNDVVKTFNERKLEVIKPEEINNMEQYGFGAVTKELISFSIPSIGESVQGCILSFEVKESLDKVKKYYLDLNNDGIIHTWSFPKDNILFVVDGVVPEEKAREYESALSDLRQNK
jgi:hypothetical protein